MLVAQSPVGRDRSIIIDGTVMGHDRMMTTLTSYGTIAPTRQADLIRGMGASEPAGAVNPALVAQVMAAMRQMNGGGWFSPLASSRARC